MHVSKILFGLITSASIAGLGLVGCNQTRDFEAEAQTPTSDVQTQASTPTIPQERPADVPYVPTPQPVVDAMLQMAQVNSNDVIYDLGSGDGRIPITAAQRYGARGLGIDINPQRLREANANAQKARVTDRVEFRQQDLFKTNLSNASVVTLYLLPDVNLKLRPKLLQELKPGTRIVSHAFDMGDWKPQQVRQVNGNTIYLWVVPENPPR